MMRVHYSNMPMILTFWFWFGLMVRMSQNTQRDSFYVGLRVTTGIVIQTNLRN